MHITMLHHHHIRSGRNRTRPGSYIPFATGPVHCQACCLFFSCYCYQTYCKVLFVTDLSMSA